MDVDGVDVDGHVCLVYSINSCSMRVALAA
jgi:hypothetical protein